MSPTNQTRALKPQAIVEAVFDVAYLMFAIGAGLYMLLSASPENELLRLYGALSLVLGCGDAFHLVPRIYGSLSGGMDRLVKPLGLGKLVTSVTMTVFYVLLYRVWLVAFGLLLAPAVSGLFYVLAALRILLSLCPQNRWLDEDAPFKWAVLRNIPFLIMGAMVLVLFAVTASATGNPFRMMPLAIALSFGFYIPVVLLAKKYPAVGALMLPKTVAYVWIICMGFALV